MRRFRELRVLAALLPFARSCARRLGVAFTCAFWGSWWAISTVATSGWTLAIGAAMAVVSGLGAAVCWRVSGE